MKILWLLTESYRYVPLEGEDDGCGALPNGPHEQVDIREKCKDFSPFWSRRRVQKVL